MAELQKNALFTLADKKPIYGMRIEDSMAKYGRNSGYDAEAQLIRGTMSFSKDKLQELDPSYTGYTHIFVLRLPAFMTAIAQGRIVKDYDKYDHEAAAAVAARHCKNLKVLLEMGSTSYSGTPDLTMNTSEVSVGWSERSYPAPTYSQYDGKQFTIKCLETRGEPLRRAMEWYINGITDANVKATMLHGAADANGWPMEPTLANYTFALMVIQTDQTLRYIQDISIWNSCIITSAERSGQLDWDNGTIDIVQPLDVPFVGVYMPDAHNELIDNKALELLGARLRYFKRFEHLTNDDLAVSTWNAGSWDGSSSSYG